MPYSGNVHEILLDGKKILLIGTAHISQSSVDEVKTVINKVKPDTVCIELCSSRYQAMLAKDQWKNGKTFCSFFLFLVNFKMNFSLTSTDHKFLTLKKGNS